jgi:hypothetical protein
MARKLPCCFSLMARPSITYSLSLNMAAANAFPRRRLNAVPSALQVYVQAPQQFDNHPEDPDSRPKEGSSNNLADLVMRLYEPPACMESIFTMAYPKNRSCQVICRHVAAETLPQPVFDYCMEKVDDPYSPLTSRRCMADAAARISGPLLTILSMCVDRLR